MGRHAVVDAVDKEDTERDAELERTSDQATESRGCSLCLEHGNETRGGTDTETGQETADTDLGVLVLGRSLEQISVCCIHPRRITHLDGDSDHEDEDEDETSDAQTDLDLSAMTLKSVGTTHSVSNGARAKGTEEGADGEDTSDSTLTNCGKRANTRGVTDTEAR